MGTARRHRRVLLDEAGSVAADGVPGSVLEYLESAELSRADTVHVSGPRPARGGTRGPFLQGGSVDVVNQQVVDWYCGRWVAVDEAADVGVDVVVCVLEAGGLAVDVVEQMPEVGGAVLVGCG